MGDLLTILAPFIVALNGILLIANEIISAKQEKEKNTEYEEIKERWKRVS